VRGSGSAAPAHRAQPCRATPSGQGTREGRVFCAALLLWHPPAAGGPAGSRGTAMSISCDARPCRGEACWGQL